MPFRRPTQPGRPTGGPPPGPPGPHATGPRLKARLARVVVISGGAAKGAFGGVLAAHMLHIHTPRGVAMTLGAAAGVVTTSFMTIAARSAYARLRNIARRRRPQV